MTKEGGSKAVQNPFDKWESSTSFEHWKQKVNQTIQTLEQLSGEFALYFLEGLSTDEINFILNHPECFRDVLTAYLKEKKTEQEIRHEFGKRYSEEEIKEALKIIRKKEQVILKIQQIQQDSMSDIEFIMSNYRFFMDVVEEYLRLKREGEADSNKLPAKIYDSLSKKYPGLSLNKVQRAIKIIQKITKGEKNPKQKLKSLQNLIEQRFSFKLDGERVWIYQTTITQDNKKIDVWKFRIPPGLRKSNPDLALFFDLSNEFGIDARSWIENPEEAAKQFN